MKKLNLLLLLLITSFWFKSYAGNYTVNVGETINLYCTATAPGGGWITHAFYSLTNNYDANYIALRSYSNQQYATVTGLQGKSKIKVQVTYCYTYRGTYDNNLHVGSGTYYDYITVNKGVTPTGITITPSNATIRAGETVTLTAELTPKNAYITSYGWGIIDGLSSKPFNFTISCEGNKCYVTAKKGVGKLFVIAQTDDGKVVASAIVTATEDGEVVEPTELTLTTDAVVMNVGETKKIGYSVLPIGATTSVTWESLNENVVTIDNKGNISAVDKGETKVVATTANGIQAECKVMVTKPLNMTGSSDKIFQYQNPMITFSDEIIPGFNFGAISITDSQNGKIQSECIVQGDTLFVCFTERPLSGTYKISVPSYSISSCDGEFNDDLEVSFSVKGNEVGTVKQAAVGKLIMTNGEFYCWGRSYSSAIWESEKYNYPDPSMAESFVPVLVYVADISQFHKNWVNNYLLKSDGTLIGWGGNYNCVINNGYQDYYSSGYLLGDGTKETRLTPVTILEDVKKVCASNYTKGAIKTDNTLWMWGRNEAGQVGNGKKTDTGQTSPVKVLENVIDVSTGDFHTVALKDDGSVWVWGGSECVGTSSSQTTPLQKTSNAVAISAGGGQTLVLKRDGSVWSFGENDMGQVGDGTTTNRVTPYNVISDVKYIEANSWQSLAIKNDGSLWIWGLCTNGVGTTSEQCWLKPKKVLDNVVKAYANTFNCYALKDDGTFWGMGYNRDGQLGTGTKENTTTMVKITDDVADFWNNYVLKTDGSLWGWGSSYIGDGSTKMPSKLVKILDAPTAIALEDVAIDVNADLAEKLEVKDQLLFRPVLTPYN